ncbi:hypothetical protein [Pseudorhodobacter aquimaris]|uniref:hypothetical protein n=1 Tax=Pseudorhodobacter aquimaris TaxID=687412 RepID=UPI0012ED0FC6|nr:hypothetical protein [Pseudorhodobacter aquimaris]
MHRYLIICAIFLTACGEERRTVYAVPQVSADLRQAVIVRCPSGDTLARAGVCLIRLEAGLRAANEKIGAIDEILTKAEATQ